MEKGDNEIIYLQMSIKEQVEECTEIELLYLISSILGIENKTVTH